MSDTDLLRQILELARWAPSGDNTQPWRFEIRSDTYVVVHGFDTRKHCVYDIDGRPSQMSIGALLETMDLAASSVGWTMNADLRPGQDDRPTFDVHFSVEADRPRNPLVDVITTRSVQRRSLSTRALTTDEKQALEDAVGPLHRIIWMEGWQERFACARLMYANAKIRLTIPEAYEVHRSIIDWGQRYSEDKVPDQALGADVLTLKLMRFAMRSWSRIDFMNRWLAGTIAPRLQMDLLPGLACAAHFAIVAHSPPNNIGDWVCAGRAMQRLWLTAAHLGLQKQPELTPIIFGRYVKAGRTFSSVDAPHATARQLRKQLAEMLAVDPDKLVWMARIGEGLPPRARSLRRPLAKLIVADGSTLTDAEPNSPGS